MLGQRRRRWPSIKTALVQRLLFAASCAVAVRIIVIQYSTLHDQQEYS